MKKIVATAGFLAMAASVSACGGLSDDDGSTASESVASDPPTTDGTELDNKDEDADHETPRTHPEEEPEEEPGDDAPEDVSDNHVGGGDDQVGEGDAENDQPSGNGVHEVVSEKRPLTFDVPDGWTVERPGVMTGFEEEDPDAPFGYSPVVGMSGVATYKERGLGCGLAPGKVGTNGIGKAGFDTERAAQGTAILWTKAAYGDGDEEPRYELSDPEPFEANGLAGHYVIVDVTPVAHECHPEKAQVRVASFDSPGGDDVYNLIIYADASGDLAPEATDLDMIISSIRPSRS